MRKSRCAHLAVESGRPRSLQQSNRVGRGSSAQPPAPLKACRRPLSSIAEPRGHLGVESGPAAKATSHNPRFSLGVALHEPDVIEPGPMLEIVQRLADVVSDTVKAFKPYLA